MAMILETTDFNGNGVELWEVQMTDGAIFYETRVIRDNEPLLVFERQDYNMAVKSFVSVSGNLVKNRLSAA